MVRRMDKDMISKEVRQRIEPKLKEMLPKKHSRYMDSCFDEVYKIQVEGMTYIVIKPPYLANPISETPNLCALFNELTGSFFDIGDWECVKEEGVLL